MKKIKSSLKRISEKPLKPEYFDAKGVIKLLMQDHKALKKLMKVIKSQKSSDALIEKSFLKLKATVKSHVHAEEKSLLRPLINHPRFEDEVREGYEEHRVHEYIFSGIAKVSDKKRKIEQIKIYCEVLEHHLEEEENDLFPKVRKYIAKSTRQKMGVAFTKRRKETTGKYAKRI